MVTKGLRSSTGPNAASRPLLGTAGATGTCVTRPDHKSYPRRWGAILKAVWRPPLFLLILVPLASGQGDVKRGAVYAGLATGDDPEGLGVVIPGHS